MLYDMLLLPYKNWCPDKSKPVNTNFYRVKEASAQKTGPEKKLKQLYL